MSDRVITMRRLGTHGRFANQLFQYAFLHAYAEPRGLEVQIPSWAGKHLFGLHDSPVSVKLPQVVEKAGDDGYSIPPVGDELVNKDWAGYGQFHTSWYATAKQHFHVPFQPIHGVRNRIKPALDALRSRGKTIVGIHLRRGDYGRSLFYVTPVSWYLDWLAKHWGRLDNPVLFIATEDASLATEFAGYNPCLTEDLGINLQDVPLANCTYLPPDLQDHDPRAMDFYPDFWLLQHSNILLIPNSSFSFVAAMLNKNLQELWRSDLPTATFHKIDPWNSHPLLQDKAEDYKHIPGVCLDETKYWVRTGTNKFREK